MTSDEEAVGWIREKADAWTAESITLRKIKLPEAGDSPAVFHEARMTARARLDRLEGILSECMALHGMVARSYEAAKDAAQDAWDEVITERKKLGRDSEYTSGKEREAWANLATRQQRQLVRERRELLSYVREVLDRLWLKYNAVRSTKGDLADEIKYLTWESHLER